MQALTFFFAFMVVLALIGVAAWLVRRFASNRLGANPNRGRMPRLAVIDAAAVDGRRRLVLVRRDNVEHLLMIGGPTDIVVEPNIVRATPTRDQVQSRPGVGGVEPSLSKVAPLPEPSNWAESEGGRYDPRSEAFDLTEPMADPPPRPSRPSFAEEMRRSAPALPERRGDRGDPLAGFAPEPIAGRPEPRPELRGEAMQPRGATRGEPVAPRPSRPSEAPKAPVRAPERAAPPPAPQPSATLSAADQNLAEMAQRLEAALRRPAGEAGEMRVGAPPVAPQPEPSMAPP
ncbi:MAG TPA: flagellar biosynthetic protein FliO, partial [Bradyrhizobium sp.]|nr:flagellar biosynthetic protein FliO [Bradyrhizobium sp.]